MLRAAFLWFAAAAPAADTAPLVGAPESLTELSAPTTDQATSFWQLVIEQQLIIRVPAQRSPINNFTAGPMPSRREVQLPIIWKEKKAPKCVPMRSIMGMQAAQRDSIDLITRQKQRLRAQLNRGCRALDFYAGFYMEGTKDGQLCEGRDQIHARTGAKCEIDKFRWMVAVREEE
ncbi:MAG: hypothetical protein KYX64_09550 [Sphingopyxis sp.]|nr:hypothetical protein [Sphingopyxis sp.]